MDRRGTEGVARREWTKVGEVGEQRVHPVTGSRAWRMTAPHVQLIHARSPSTPTMEIPTSPMFVRDGHEGSQHAAYAPVRRTGSMAGNHGGLFSLTRRSRCGLG